ncbi:hypothetical protein D1632_06125 [Chryseobacterium nematophagum]|uniref:Uncharacterized protein n=1 Tax=Chryseobacterium nematophagum TaxID=2305228 RepID=A0A3M7LB01_9FLAO|nr:hypothetical protein D1632_06125 [Chryseobacterium nematophagum]
MSAFFKKSILFLKTKKNKIPNDYLLLTYFIETPEIQYPMYLGYKTLQGNFFLVYIQSFILLNACLN